MGPSPIIDSFNRDHKKVAKKLSEDLAHEIALAVAMPFWFVAAILLFFAILLALL